jgi:hypothetical protein
VFIFQLFDVLGFIQRVPQPVLELGVILLVHPGAILACLLAPLLPSIAAILKFTILCFGQSNNNNNNNINNLKAGFIIKFVYNIFFLATRD